MRTRRIPALDGARALLLVGIAAAVVRIIFVFLNPPDPAEVTARLADSADYDHLARTILDNFSYSAPDGSPTAFRPPVYPVFLAIIYAIAGAGNYLAVCLVQALLGGLNAILAGLIARRLTLSNAASLAVAGIMAIYPAFIMQTTQVLTEVLSRTQLLAAVLALLVAWDGQKTRYYIVAGALMALAILNKSALGACVPFIGVAVLLFSAGEWKPRLFRAMFYAASAALILGAWCARNFAASGEIIPVSTNFPVTFAQGLTRYSFYTNEWYGDAIELLPADEDYLWQTQLRAYHGIEDELARGDIFMAEARAFLAENKAFFTKLTVRKALHFWSPTIRNRPLYQFAAFASMAPVLLCGWIGVILSIARGGHWRRFGWLCLAIAIPVTIPYAISQPDVRYRLALVDPLWIVACGILLDKLIERWRNR